MDHSQILKNSQEFGADRQPEPSKPFDRTRADPTLVRERYRTLCAAASPGTIEQAYSRALSTLAPETRQDLHRKLMSSLPREAFTGNLNLPTGDAAPMARLMGCIERQQPGWLDEHWDRLGLNLSFAAFAAIVLDRAQTSEPEPQHHQHESGRHPAQPAENADADADFSEEFGYEHSPAGGEGFENDDFDRFV